MHDDFESGVWASHHATLSRSLHGLLRSIDFGLRRLNRFQFSAPWRERRPSRHA